MATLKSKEPVSLRPLSTREQIILLESSRLHGSRFPPWRGPPDMNEFEPNKGHSKFLDDAYFGLSEAQLMFFDGWKRPDDLLFGANALRSSTPRLEGLTMTTSTRINLVQDVTSDCSVVASLCACVARIRRGHPMLLSSILYPYDQGLRQPVASKNGKYILRLYFNGCWRKVIIDDRLPSSNGLRTLHVIDRSNPEVLWPALVEKAYLKVRGGYDFPGSNSGSDLWILTGWIPEQVFLYNPDVERERLWHRLLGAFGYGDVIITLGTGKVSELEEKNTGLAGEHDYAVLDLQEHDGQRLFLIKNPWSERNTATEADEAINLVACEASDASSRENPSAELEAKRPSLEPGTFWMSITNVFQCFETMYLNWNPSLFAHRQDIHFRWDLTKSNGLWASFGNNPQYQIHSKVAGTVWLLLTRHFKSSPGPVESDKSSSTSTMETGFTSLYVFRNKGQRVFLTDGFAARGPYVDSPNTLMKFELPEDSPHTVLVSQQELHPSSYSFTLSAFSLQPLILTEAQDKYQFFTVKTDAWTPETAGGNANNPSYSKNPQFSLHLPQTTGVLLLLEVRCDEFPVHIRLVWSDGKPTRLVGNHHIIGDSGEYRKGHAIVEVPNVPAGRYKIICSTFEQGQLGTFQIQVRSMSACTIERSYARPAGQYVNRPATAVFVGETECLWAPLRCRRLARLCILARSAGTEGISSSRGGSTGLPLKLSVDCGQGLMKKALAISNDDEFSNGHYGVEVIDVDLQPSMCAHAGVRIVLERAVSLDLHREESVEVEIYSDAIVDIGPWFGN